MNCQSPHGDLWCDERFFHFFHLISGGKNMISILGMTAREPIRFSELLWPKAEKAAKESASEADAMVLTGIYSSDASNFVPGQRTR
jgi:hypothetical protein